MKSKKKKIGDTGIRLKPNEPNILENYTKYRKKTKKSKKKKKKPKKSIKKVDIIEKTDPFTKIIEDSRKKENISEIEVKEMPIKKIHVDNKPKDLSNTDPNITKKTLTITASLKPDKKKEGGNILLE